MNLDKAAVAEDSASAEVRRVVRRRKFVVLFVGRGRRQRREKERRKRFERRKEREREIKREREREKFVLNEMRKSFLN